MMFQALSSHKLFRTNIMLLVVTIIDVGEKKSVWKKMFVPQKDQLAWDRKKFHKQNLQDLYSSPNIIRVEHVGKRRGACRI